MDGYAGAWFIFEPGIRQPAGVEPKTQAPDVSAIWLAQGRVSSANTQLRYLLLSTTLKLRRSGKLRWACNPGVQKANNLSICLGLRKHSRGYWQNLQWKMVAGFVPGVKPRWARRGAEVLVAGYWLWVHRCVDLIRVWHSSAGNCRRRSWIVQKLHRHRWRHAPERAKHH